VGVLLVVFRCLLALVFAVAAAGKLLDLAGSVRALVDFGVSERLALLAAPPLPLIEVAAAGLLLANPAARYGAALAAVLLVGFAAGITRALARGRAPDCHCFGQLHSEPAGSEAIARNLLLAALALAVVVAPSSGRFPATFGHLSEVQVALVIASVLALALALLSASLSAARRRLTKDLQTVSAAARRAGLPRASQAPGFELDTVAGEAGALSELLAQKQPVVLVVLSTECGPCLRFLPELARWQEVLAQSASLPAIFSGQRDAIERLVSEHKLRSALAQEASEVFELYALRATPSAVAIDHAGVIVASAAEGPVAIETLIRSTLHTRAPSGLRVEQVGAAARAASVGQAQSAMAPTR
jgi:thiol-disulfide isomerase/thioredoxin